MHKQHVLRAPLIAALGFLAFLLLPAAAAQAHHMEKPWAKCAYVDGTPTIQYGVSFEGFGSADYFPVTGAVSLDGTEVKTYSLSQGDFSNGDYTLTDAVPATAGEHTIKGKFWWGKNGKYSGSFEKTVTCYVPAIDLEKSGPATANQGDTVTYSFVATNTGNVTLENVELTDDKCQATLTRVEPNLSDATFDPGDKWYYQCTVTAPAGPAEVVNTAEVCGDWMYKGKPKAEVCDTDTHTYTVPPPTTPPDTPPTTPPGTPPFSPPPVTPEDVGPSGEGGVLPESIVSGRAVLRGPSGCVKQAFRARVSGRQIRSVTFYVDGRKVKTDRRSAFGLKVRPNRYGLGRHKIVALVRFNAESGTRARRLPLTFRRCAQGAVAPRFTG